MRTKRHACPSCFHRWRIHVSPGKRVECPKCGYRSIVVRLSRPQAPKDAEPAVPVSAGPPPRAVADSAKPKTTAPTPDKRTATIAFSVFAVIIVFALGLGLANRMANPGKPVSHATPNADMNPAVPLIMEYGRSQEIAPHPGQLVPPQADSRGWANVTPERQQFEIDQMIRQGVKPNEARAFVDTLFEAEREHQRKFRK
jgi:hypothetical protein